ncbi:MAG TPA: hypothetical protein VGB98_04445 [Pyrinomonadaceae bacterium]|jgi:hypothetical protein
MKELILKRIIPAALAALAFALVLACFELTASAQAPAPSSVVGVSPIVVEAVVESGGSLVARFQITNRARSAQRVRCSLKDVWHERGQRTEAAPGTQPRSASSWLRFNPSELVVQPNSTATVEAVVTLPKDAEGSYYTMPVFEISPVAEGRPGNTAAFVYRIQGRVVVTTARGSNYSLNVVGGKVSAPTPSAPLVLTLDLANAGNTHLIPSVSFAVLDQSGRLVGRGKLPTKKLMPSEQAELSGSWSGALPPGRYNVVSSVTYKAASDNKTVIKEITFAVP